MTGEPDTAPISGLEGLPALLREIAEVAGLDAALGLARARGGTRVYIPAKAGAAHWLVKAVGGDAADLICDHFTMNGIGMRVDIPFGPVHSSAEKMRRLDNMIREGKSAREISQALGQTERSVFYRRARLKKLGHLDKGQSDLFL